MSAAITTTATTLPAQFAEVAAALAAAELAASTDTNTIDNITIGNDTESGVFQVTAIIPATFAPTATGYSVAVTDYLP